MLREQVFSDINRYSVVSDTTTPIDVVEWFAKNKGITDLDKPGAKIRTIIDDANESELARQKAKKLREAIARSEYIDALMNLEDGTAVHHKQRDRTPLLSAKSSKPKRPARGKSNSEYKAARDRRAILVAELKAGKTVKLISQKKDEVETNGYHQQYADIASIRHKQGLKVARVYCNQTGQSYYTIDKFVRYPLPISVSGTRDDKNELLTALLSKQLVPASSMPVEAKVASKSVLRLMRKHDLDIHTVFNDSKTDGWIFIPNEEKIKAKIQKLGDMLQAMDHLKEEKAKAGQ